ncbi:SpoIIE family protein phosphatase [candidate division KSB1 bacterium]|nr:SpoIIE family protein phosphatase [candidate division KSB1 bacterium]
MNWKHSRSDSLLLIFAFIGLFVTVVFFQSLFPEAALRVPLKKQEIVKNGEDFVQSFGYDVASIPAQIELRSQGDQIRFLNRKVGLARTNQLIQDSIPAFYWRLHWRLEESDSLQVSFSSGAQEVDIHDFQTESLELFLTTAGQPIFMEYQMESDDYMIDYTPEQMSYDIQYAAARDLANSILPQFHHLWLTTENSDTMTYPAVDREFMWERIKPIASESVRFKVNLTGDKITGFNKEFIVPASPSIEDKRQGVYEGIGFVLKYLFIAILALYYFVTRLKLDALDLKSGLIAGLLVLLSWAVVFWAQISGERGWQVLIGFVITTPFVAGGIWLLFALGEAMTREVWSDKLITVDGLRKKLFFPAFGRSIFHGLAIGAILLGAYSTLVAFSVNISNGYFHLGHSALNHWTAPVPILHLLGKSLMAAIYLITTYCLFFQSWVRKRIKKQWAFLLILLLFWSFLGTPVPGIRPFGIASLQNALLGILVVIFFARYDYVAVTVGLASQSLMFYGLAALFIGGFLTFHGILVFSVLFLLIILAILANRGMALSSEITEFVPGYLQRVYERERIKRELEIARNIQISLLPRSNPDIEDLDVASLCVPAKEVGGDYFDFILLGPKKLGVVIGDVSGKGIPAAFYMTLTKGLFKSQAQVQQSPRDVLINLNTLFYENAERGIFISMIYAIFDLENRKLTTARAGHNPMMLLRAGSPLTEEICPKGMALGFEPGDLFKQTIEEIVLELKKDDVFLFYTDGLNEAQNQFHREFGEERLKRVVQECGSEKSDKIVQCIRNEIAQFTGDAPQHDDMTAVVVRVMKD